MKFVKGFENKNHKTSFFIHVAHIPSHFFDNEDKTSVNLYKAGIVYFTVIYVEEHTA